ncbi:MAG: hypothetical protein N2509_07935 [Treponemataceae bacterium]|nr:hypothetical protein [Treponemataceae bacterium]
MNSCTPGVAGRKLKRQAALRDARVIPRAVTALLAERARGF